MLTHNGPTRGVLELELVKHIYEAPERAGCWAPRCWEAAAVNWGETRLHPGPSAATPQAITAIRRRLTLISDENQALNNGQSMRVIGKQIFRVFSESDI